MRDLDAIDQQLRDLGQPPGDRAALLARVLGADRSRNRLEELLAGIAANAPAVTPAPALAFAPALAPVGDDDPDTEKTDPSEAAALADELSHDTFVGRPPAPPDDDEPELSLSTAPSEPPSEPPAETDSSRFAAMFDFTSPPPPRESMRGAPRSDRPPAESSEFDEPRRARSDQPEPPDEEITARRSVPAPPEPVAAVDDDSDAEEADFELLVDDEDIIEIDDEEMQIVDDE